MDDKDISPEIKAKLNEQPTPVTEPQASVPVQKPAVPPPVSRTTKFMTALTIMFVFAVVGAIAGLFMAYTQEIPEITDLRSYKPNLTTAVYDLNGNLISQLYAEQRTLVKLAQIPAQLQNAFISKEDPRFFQHSGIDLKGIARAAVNNLAHGKIVEGGSTITQQLARNLFLTREKSFGRKIKEVMLSMQIEKYYTKNEILELYCNQVYFGNGAYGVEAAARTYFGKHVEELLLPEAATLSALPQAPSQFNPYQHPETAIEKRNLVLGKMFDAGFITEAEKTQAIAAPMELHKLEVKNAPYFVEYVRQQMETTYGNTLIYKGGLKVYTTLDSVMQDTAQEVFNLHLQKIQAEIEANLGEKLNYPLQGAMLGIDPRTGYVKVMIGGIDFSKSEFNRAVQSRRQSGSAFKPIVYAAAIDNGFRVSDVIMDSPIVFKNADGNDWKPENISGKFSGPSILLNGLTYSKNVVTVKLLNKVGIGTTAMYARKLGITSPLSKDLTMGLGSSSLSLMEMVNAFACFANGGMRVSPVSILNVNDSNGKLLEQNTSKLEQTIAPSTAYIMNYMLENVVNKGTGKAVRQLGFKGPCAGKTGTTNDYSDVWFIGYTPDLVLGIWIGFDTKETLGKNMTGGRLAAPIFGEFAMNVFGGQANGDFLVPDNIIFRKICVKTGNLAGKNCPNPIDAPFVEGSEPREYCALHNSTSINDFRSEDMEAVDEEALDPESGETTSKSTNKTKTKATIKTPDIKSEDEEDMTF